MVRGQEPNVALYNPKRQLAFRIFSKPPNDEERSLLHLLAPHIRDKQYPWHPTLTCQEIKHPIPQSSL
jgi:hypothetical protein